jgi:DNA-directed RNA polymerase subunit RPC12/RpoP
MADISFTCPKCNEIIEAPEEYRGKTVNCPSCKMKLAVPNPGNTRVFEPLPKPTFTPPSQNVVIVDVQIPFNSLCAICIKIFVALNLIVAALAGVYGIILGVLWLLGSR